MNRINLIIFLFVLFVFSCNRNDNPFEVSNYDMYVKSNQYPFSIRQMRLPHQITSSGFDFVPIWSPDGEHIAFSSVRNTYIPGASSSDVELWIMEENGYGQRTLISPTILNKERLSVGSVSWFKDSESLLVRLQSHNRSSEVWKISLNGDMIQLSSLNYWINSPSISPDNLKIAYFIQGPNPLEGSPIYRLYVANCDGSDPVLIEEGLFHGYTWQYNSQSLVYSLVDNTSRSCDLWMSSISGTNKRQITSTPVSEERPLFSPDGQQLVFSVEDTIFVTLAQEFAPEKLFTDARHGKWVPSINLLLIIVEQTYDNISCWTESWIIDLDGNVVRKIAEGDVAIVDFSPDGKYIVYSLSGNFWIDNL